MGILNVTPDSFYDGGLHFDLADTQKRVDAMVKEGVEIIDIGGESTRPGSKDISLNNEFKRVEKVLKKFIYAFFKNILNEKTI